MRDEIIEPRRAAMRRTPVLLVEKYLLVTLLFASAATLLVYGAAVSGWWIIAALLAALLAVAIVVLAPVLDDSAHDRPMAKLIAFIGSDGSGKSTLSADMLAEFSREMPMRLCYLGLGSGALGERIKRLPVIGRAVERRLVAKANQARTTGERIPGLPTAIVVYIYSTIRLRRFRRMLAVRRSGVAVLTDRYPQVEVPGFYDGPGLSAARADNWLVAALVRRERRMYEWMASFHPDVVIRLNVDVETAFARKPDHRFDLLGQKVAVTPGLRFDGARIVDLDSRLPYEVVRAEAKRIVGRTLLANAPAD